MHDTIIIGAGPIGSYLASKLARLGYKVLVLEQKSSAGSNICCTGIISKECYDLLNIPETFIRQANSAKFVAPSGYCLRLWRNDEVAIITDRSFLEQALASKAQTLGADYHFNTQVKSIETTANRLVVRAIHRKVAETFTAETAVIATGYGSELPGNLGLGKIKHFTLGAQAEVETNTIEEVEIYFDQTLVPGGFGWLVPTRKNRGLAGLIASRQPEWHLKQLLLKLKSEGKITSTDVTRNHAVIPLQPLPKTYGERLVVVGEAAGQVKPTTGGGIYYGMLCADIATNVFKQILSSCDTSTAQLSTYQRQWKNKLARELMIGYWAQYIWSRLSNNQIERLLRIAQRIHIPEHINTMKSFTFDWHGQLLLQMAYSLLPFAKTQKKL